MVLRQLSKRLAARLPRTPQRHTQAVPQIACQQIRPISLSGRTDRRAQSAQAAYALQPDEPSTSYTPPVAPAYSSSSLNTAEEADFKAYFDHYGGYGSTSHGGPREGLFLFPPLQTPGDLPRLTTRTLVHGRAIVDRICAAPSAPGGEKELRLVVKNLDRLSDLLCGVIDMCELVRNVHTDVHWIRGSDAAYERLCSFMNELNTDQGLYKALLVTLKHPFTHPLSEAETQVALTFLRDFEKSGIHLPSAQRQRFVDLSDSILSLGRTFLSNVAAGPRPHPMIEIPDAERLLSGMGSQFIDSLPRGGIGRRDTRYVTPGSWESQMIGRYAREGEARRLVYTGGLQKDEERIEVLERMLRERAELAGVLGKETWAEVALVDKMAKTPGNVMGFLNSLADHHRALAAQDIARLQRFKASSITGNAYSQADGTGHLPPLYAWDRDFYSEKYTSTLANGASLPPISPYFSTGTVMLGLSKLFTRLYGISFRPCASAPGEIWHDSVRKLEVVDENGIIGVIYCDLFSREGKPPSAAHYTVRCSRRVDDDDFAGDGLPAGWDAQYGPGLEVEGEPIAGRNGRYQTPIVVLTTDFGSVEPGRPALLHWNDVETLFHEMGHAIHSMIGRTEYHNVSGTRCATDFVELPSILMEHFVSSPDVLGLFATHFATGEPLPMSLLHQHLAIQKSLSALETHGQIGMAMLDQSYHSLTSADLGSFDSTAMHYELQQRIGVIPPVKDMAWQTQFGHLYGYGATYYSYLFDRAIAGKVFGTLFSGTRRGEKAGGALNRDGGELLKESLLKWGGGRDPWVMVGEVVGGKEGEVLMRGDEESMRVVGGWEIR